MKPNFICLQAPSWSSPHYASLLLKTRNTKEMQAKSGRGPEGDEWPLSGDLVGALGRPREANSVLGREKLDVKWRNRVRARAHRPESPG